MRGGRAALLLIPSLVLAGLWLVPLGTASSPAAQSPARPPRHGVVILYVLPSLSFEQAMAVPPFGALSRAGGSGLMTTAVGSGDRVRASLLSIENGSASSADTTSRILTDSLQAHGIAVCVEGRTSQRSPGPQGAPNAGGAEGSILLLGTDSQGQVGCSLGAPTPQAPAAASSRDAVLIIDASAARGERISGHHPPGVIEGVFLRRLVGSLGNRPALVVVMSPLPSAQMDRGGDETTPLVMAEGLAARLMPSAGPLHGLTSDTTRQAGLVSNSDVAPTVLGFFGLPIPSRMAGQRIRATGDPPPFDLHRQELEMRRIRLPLQLGEVAFVAAAGIIASIALIVLALRGSMPRRPSAALRFMSLCGAAFGVPLLAGGFLPRFTYAVVVPFLVISVLGLAGLSLLFRRPHPLGPFAFIGLVGLAFMAVEAVLGGRAFRTPLFGGTMFDGIRFYGLTNSFIALLLASALFVAFRLGPFPGFLLVVAAGLFGGFPRLGANLGAAAELFVAAAMWWVLRGRRRFGVGEALFAIGVVLAGIGTVLLVNRFAPGAPTHITRFVEQTGQGAGGALGAIGHRLGVGLHQLVGYPTAFIPLVGLVVVLILALREPAFVRAAVALDPPWSEVLIVLTGASLIGYFLNDTGASAAAPGFLYAMSALTYPSFLVAASRTMPGPLGSVLPHHLGRGRRRVGREAPAESSEVSETGSGRKQPPPRGPERG